MRKTGTESPSGLALDLGHVNAWMQASRASTRAAEILPPAIALGATFYNLFVAARPAPLGTAELALNVVVICALALTMTLIAITGFSRQIVTWSATLAIEARIRASSSMTQIAAGDIRFHTQIVRAR